jgi:hypothetical protein
MLKPLPLILAPILVLVLLFGFGLKLDRALTQPLAPQAAATEGLSRGLAEAGWSRLGETALLADGSFTAQRFQRGACHLEVALLPPGDQYLAVLREAWGGQARFLADAGFSAAAPEAGRAAQLARHLAHALGLGPRPGLFGVAAASGGDCPVWLWQELARLQPG